MTDPRIIGNLERIARALEEQARLQRQALERLDHLVDDGASTDDQLDD